MKRIGHLFDAIIGFENLYLAYLRARNGKRDRQSVDRFSFHLEPEILYLRQELLTGTYCPGDFVEFRIHDPKPRTIHAAPFRDRVLHHAIMMILEPYLDRSLDPDSFACRRGKGMDAALRRAQSLTRESCWILKSDIEKFFHSVDHEILLEMLARRFKDRRLLWLLERIIRHGGGGGKGLPIGNLTSQWFANIYLGELDRHVRHELRPGGYIRYMDDFALLDRDRERLKHFRKMLSAWLAERLELKLKEDATQIYPGGRGWPFLGFRIYPRKLEIRRTSWKLFKRRSGSDYHLYRRGFKTVEDVTRSMECRVAHLRRACTAGLRRKDLKVTEI